MVVDIKRRGEKIIRIVNIHVERTREPRDRPARRLSWQEIIRHGGGGTVLAGDFNAHSQRCDPRCTERRDAAYWDDITDEHGLVLGNDDRPTHNWTRNESEG